MSKIFEHKTLFIEKAVSEPGNYVFFTKDPMGRNDIRRSLIRAMNGSVKHPTGTSSTFSLKNGAKVTVMVHPTKSVPLWMKYDGAYFDRSYD